MTNFWARTLGFTLGWCLGLGLITLLVGCTSPGQSNSGWQPQTQRELETLIGNTVMQAMDQYGDYLRKRAVPPVPRRLPGDAT